METLEQINEIIVEEPLKKHIFIIDGYPILTTFVFELKKQWKKFIILMGISIIFVFLLSYLPYLLMLDYPLPATQNQFFQGGLGFFMMIVIFTVCFFFGGIICSEFSNKTGHIVFPIINKYKIIIGKYLVAFTMVIGIVGTFYFTLGLLGIYYYGGPISIKYFYSFGIALLYALAVSSFVTLFSSFMKNVNMTIVSTIMILLIANMIIDALIVLVWYEFEPIYSLNHMSKLISYIMEVDFPEVIEDRYVDGDEARGPASDLILRNWLTPSIEGGIAIALSYVLICNIIAFIVFSRKQL